MYTKVAQKVGVNHIKQVKVSQIKYCVDCEASRTHETGSQLWLSCRFQQGWRDINSVCNLPEERGT